MAKTKIPCATISCRWCDKVTQTCTYKPHIKNQKCINFQANLFHYIVQFGVAMNNKMLPVYNLKADARIGAYYAMKVFNLCMTEHTYGDWVWYDFFGAEDENKTILTFNEIVERKANEEEFIRLENLLFEGKLPPFDEEQERLEKERQEIIQKEKEIKERNPEIENLEYGFLSPEGKFIEVIFAEHESKALDICLALWPGEYSIFRSSAVDFLVEKKGYVLFHNPYGWGKTIIQISKTKNLTKKQIEFIFDYYYSHGWYMEAQKFIQDYKERM